MPGIQEDGQWEGDVIQTQGLVLAGLWNVTGIQLTLRAFVAFLWHLTVCFDGSSCSTELDREMNEFTGKFSDILVFY